MGKYRVSFLLDTETIAPEASGLDEIAALVSDQLINGAMRAHKDALKALRDDTDMLADEKTIRTSDRLRAIMLAVMAQANLSVEEMPLNTVVETELPFEKQYAA